ncbi:MAG: hypothetical protein ACRDQF_02640 [Thermocrispum sp.]
MNVESISGWLAAIGVPPEVISVGAEADNAWCLLRTERVMPVVDASPPDVAPTEQAAPPDAPPKEQAAAPPQEPAETMVLAWEVFWREQGNRYDWASFTNEQVACHYLFGRLAWSQVARGAVGVLPAPEPAKSPVDQP